MGVILRKAESELGVYVCICINLSYHTPQNLCGRKLPLISQIFILPRNFMPDDLYHKHNP